MIGQVKFPFDGKTLAATLNDDGRWSCLDKPTEDMLNAVHPVRNYSVADGRFGWSQLHAAAETLGGTVEGIEENPETENLIY